MTQPHTPVARRDIFSVSRSTDASLLSAIARATFLETFADVIPYGDIQVRSRSEDSEAGFAQMLDDGAAAWTAQIDATGCPVGFAVVCSPELPDIAADARDLELKRIYLLHRFHGLRIGRALLDAAIAYGRKQKAGRLMLGVYHQNPTVGWYERRGFVQIGTRRFRVGTRDFDDLIMALTL